MKIHTHIRRPNKEVRATLQLVMHKLEEALRLSKIMEEEACRRG